VREQLAKMTKTDRLWKIRENFDMLDVACSKYNTPFEHLANDEVIILFKERVAFEQYIPKKHIRFGIIIYELSGMTWKRT
jgi:hypothetical protein